MESGDTLTTCPRSWLDRLDQFPGRLTIDAAGYPLAVEIAREELVAVYLPVLHHLHALSTHARRVVAGLAGIPGSGKSTFATVLAALADVLLGMGRLVALGMDGWHWPNAVLDARTTLDESGNPIPLRQRKGGPESYDVQAIAAAIGSLLAASKTVSLPVYDRRLHDPVPGGRVIGPGTAIVLLEGNFVLESTPPWNAVSDLLSPRLFLAGDAESARGRVIARHIRGGTTPEQAERKYQGNDRLNTDAVLQTARNADWVIRLGPGATVGKPK